MVHLWLKVFATLNGTISVLYLHNDSVSNSKDTGKIHTKALWRDYYIQPSKNEITVNPKTAKNHSSYSQGPKLTIFNGFRGLE